MLKLFQRPATPAPEPERPRHAASEIPEIEQRLVELDALIADLDGKVEAQSERHGRLAASVADRPRQRREILLDIDSEVPGAQDRLAKLDYETRLERDALDGAAARLEDLSNELDACKCEREEASAALGSARMALREARRGAWRKKVSDEFNAECEAFLSECVALQDHYARICLNAARVGDLKIAERLGRLQRELDAKVISGGRRYVRFHVGPTPAPLQIEATIRPDVMTAIVSDPDVPQLQVSAIELTSVRIR